ncbi:MAG TPA: hypothetical protein PKO09_18235, partial [Anaerolineae bacterium]|nr:hypothetical protein [Anaerolineae bacterium]
MDAWDANAAERLAGLVRFPTVAQESKFAGACPGWAPSRFETFCQFAPDHGPVMCGHSGPL